MGTKADYEQRRAAARQATADREAKHKALIQSDAKIFVSVFENFIQALITKDATTIDTARSALINLLCRGVI